MKAILLCCLLLVVISCEKKEEIFQPYFYDGEYPATMTGSRIRTYEPEKIGGEMEVFFKGHTWNHAPYLSLNASLFDSSRTGNGQGELEVGVSSLLTKGFDACIFESLYIRIPLAKGRFVFTKDLPPKGAITSQFYSINCDAGKDGYIVDHSSGTSSWIDVKRYDAISRVLEAEFNISFVVKDRNYSFAPINPIHIHMRGTLKTVAKVSK